MILIVDSGSTKADWTLVDQSGKMVGECRTQGINPVHQTDDEILRVLREELTLPEHPTEVFFYGSGVTEAQKPRMKSLLAEAFPGAKVEAESDLVGAARALFGDQPGIACILGTGANSCLYDGSGIVMNTPPLGYILGDEGSGAVLGRHFLNGIFKGTLPASLRDKYLAWSKLDYPSIINKVYREPLANRYLASICPFISKVMADGLQQEEESDEFAEAMGLYRLVLDGFKDFHDHNLVPYIEHCSGLGEGIPDVGFVGSIAHYFESPLRDILTGEYHLSVLPVMKSPMQGLIKFHAN